MNKRSGTAKRVVSLLTVGALLGAGMLAGTTAANGQEPTPPDASYTSTDAGDGTYTVPLLNSDVPDVSVTMVPAADNDEHRDTYYMISTTMHLSPGAPIMKSYDLVNWETVNYVYDRLSIGDALSLRNGKESYGQGQWASSIRYHDGRFYVLFNTNNVNGAYLFTTDDIDHGAWQKTALGRGFHDPSLFFDTDGTAYIFYGSGSTSAVKLSADLKTVVAEYPSIFSAADYAGRPYIGGLFEGAQVYKIGEYYYVFIITWPSGGNRQEVVFRSKYLLGKHQAPGGANTYEARSALDSNGFAQGGLVEITHEGAASDWYGFFFRDTYPVGRIPALIPATWTDGWPTFGNNGVVPYGGTFEKPIRLTPAQENLERQKSIVASDDFDNDAPHRAYMDEEWDIPASPGIDPTLLGTNLLQNPGFEDATVTPWGTQYGATVTRDTSGPASGTAALLVSNRTLNGSAPNQFLQNTLQKGVTYTLSAKVKHQHTSAITFNLCLDFGAPVNLQCASGGSVPPNTWTTITRTYTVPDNAVLSNVKFALETPWGSPQPATSSVSYLVDDASVVGQVPTTEVPNADEIAFNGSTLDTAWQWNHNPDNRYWSLTDRDGWLRLTAGKVVTGGYTYAKLSTKDELTWFEEARNTLSQRTFGPKQSVETKLDVSAMKDGDVAGLAAYARSFAYAAVKKVGGEYTLGIVYRGQPFTAAIDQAGVEAFVPGSTIALGANRDVYLKADLDFASNSGQLWIRYYYSLDGATWSQLGQRTGPLTMDWSLSHFMGYRVGLFTYATQSVGGSVDVDYYSLSDVLTADGASLSTVELDAAIARASSLDEADYPAAAWTAFTSAYSKAVAAKAKGFSTQNQIDAPARALSRQLAELAVVKAAPAIDATATTAWRCVAGKSVLTVTVTNGEQVPVKVDITTAFGAKSIAAVAPGKSVSQAFTTRQKSVEAGSASVTASATVSGETVSSTLDAPYPAGTCQ